MRIGSLFSGAGGLDMAVEAVFGATTAWHCELDPAASKVLAHRWPGVPNLGDITTIDWKRDFAWKKRGEVPSVAVDILCGGYPCQPFSAAGKRKGSTDERHLWPYFAEAIRGLRPRFVVLENVAGHRSMGFDRVLADLAGLGYDAQWCSLRASDVGAPHRRERLFVLAADAERSAGGAPSGEWSRSRQAPRTGPCGLAGGRSVLPTDPSSDGRNEGRPEPAGFERRSDAAVSGDGPVELLPTPTTQDAANCAGPSQFRRNTLPLNAEVALLQTPSTADGGGGHLNRSGNRRGEPLLPGRAREMATSWGKYEPAIRRWEHLTRPAPAPTEPNTKGNPRLAAAFSEWLMGWPAGWVTTVPDISRNDALRIVGNGVVPQQATAALRWLLTVAQQAA